jgi:hypothetical protein
MILSLEEIDYLGKPVLDFSDLGGLDFDFDEDLENDFHFLETVEKYFWNQDSCFGSDEDCCFYFDFEKVFVE